MDLDGVFIDADGVSREPSDDGGEDRNSVTRIEVGGDLNLPGQ